MTKSKPKCEITNVACGEKCQPKEYRCPSEKGLEVSAAIDKFSKLSSASAALSLFFKDSVDKISTQSKQKAREELKGKKEQLKTLRADEEKAWTFVRLWRERERLLKKKDNESADKLLKTLNLIADGDKATIAKATKELRESIETKKKLSKRAGETADEVVKAITTASVKVEQNDDASKPPAAANNLTLNDYDKTFEFEFKGVTHNYSDDIAKFDDDDDADIDSPTFITDFSESALKESLSKAYMKAVSLGARENNLVKTVPGFDQDYDIKRRTARDKKEVNRLKISIINNLLSMGEPPTEELIKQSNNYLKLSMANAIENERNYDRWNITPIRLKILKEREELRDLIIAGFYGETPSKELAPSSGDSSLRNQTQIPPVPSGLPSNNDDTDDNDLRRFLETADVLMQVPTSALLKILKQGKFKNGFHRVETGIGKGKTGYKGVRKRSEKLLLNVSDDTKADQRPIYAYAEDPRRSRSSANTLGVQSYGNIQLKFKSEVKKRSTVTFGDSLDSMSVGDKGTPMLSPSKDAKAVPVDITIEGSSSSLKFVYDNNTTKDLHRYIETQIFGGVSASDIEEVRLTKSLAESNPELLKMIIALGIEVVYVPGIIGF